MKLIGTLLTLLVLTLAVPGHAIDVSAPNPNVAQGVEMQGLNGNINTLKAQVVSATTRLFKIKECHSEGKFFRQLPNGTEGCVDAFIPN